MDLLRSLPLGLYLEQPITWMHQLDPRVKLGWLIGFLLAPVLASTLWRLGLVVLLILLTVLATIPMRVWKQQMGWLLVLCFLVMLFSAIAPDGLNITYQPRLPDAELAWQLDPSTGEAAELPPATEYNYILFQQGPITVTRRSLNLGLRLSSLLFTLIYSTNLYLLTTAPEEITAGLESLMRPLRWFRIPVTELNLTLTLSLRFIPLVLEEVQNLIRSVQTRAIDWRKLGLKGSAQVWLTVAERLLENLLMRAEQIASAMQVRGFTSPDKHRVYWSQLRLRRGDWVALAVLIAFWGVRFAVGGEA
ncbi:energy-coupling factor transporter transmembrane protein EcfT [Geitlerinema sp. PCC 9228]|jgi:energy-coupling factor transport system permease protein|uniref:energy-coupling factor transporter transmembrane component T family protein n=1 Tax=Geitlerinema sp. PCC 9228 TaxID=111611 RepID=UPI0008F98EEB|nr:energy-coupling factor transporter transmembrane protein EcfT [Geitlerinema sp. PCC 9228]